MATAQALSTGGSPPSSPQASTTQTRSSHWDKVRSPTHSAVCSPPQPELRRARDGANSLRAAFFDWYGTDGAWQTAEPVFLAWDGEKYTRAQATPPAASAHPQPTSAAQPASSSVAQPACAAPRLSEESRARKFLAALEEAAYEREDNPAQAALLREFVNSLSSGKLLLEPTADVWHLDEEQREDHRDHSGFPNRPAPAPTVRNGGDFQLPGVQTDPKRQMAVGPSFRIVAPSTP